MAITTRTQFKKENKSSNPNKDILRRIAELERDVKELGVLVDEILKEKK